MCRQMRALRGSGPGRGVIAGRDGARHECDLRQGEGMVAQESGGAGPLSGSQSMRNPPVMTERVKAQTRPI